MEDPTYTAFITAWDALSDAQRSRFVAEYHETIIEFDLQEHLQPGGHFGMGDEDIAEVNRQRPHFGSVAPRAKAKPRRD